MSDEIEFLGRARPRKKPPQPPEPVEPSEMDYSHLEGIVPPEIIEAFKRDDRRRREAGERWDEDGED